MRFTSGHGVIASLLPVPVLVLVLVLVLLAGCATAPGDKKRRPSAAHDGPVAASGASILPPGPALPNPYLSNKPRVSGAAAQRFAEATAAMDAQQWDRAEQLLQQLLAQEPQLSGAQLNLGLVYRAKGDDARAREAFTQAISVNANNLDAYNALALLERENGQFEQALGHYQKALSIWPWHPSSHKNLAILYELYLGKPEQALPHYEAYQQLAGDSDKQINSWVADLQRRLGIAPKPRAAAAPAASAADADGEGEDDQSSEVGFVQDAALEPGATLDQGQDATDDDAEVADEVLDRVGDDEVPTSEAITEDEL